MAAGIRRPLAPPLLAPLPELPTELPTPPVQAELVPAPAPQEETVARPEQRAPAVVVEERPDFQPSGPLELDSVLESVERAFPLLMAAEFERPIASGRRLAAEGAFDLHLRADGTHQSGTFSNNRFNAFAEQATPWQGMSFFGGYRFGFGDFPVYYGDRLTADGGEFRAGILLPLLRNRPIDQRRAIWRQAQLGEPLANALVQRFRIDFYRTAAHSYWSWVAAGAQFSIADRLLDIARERQIALEEQFRAGMIAEFDVIDNRRMVAEREGLLVAAERRLQQAAFDLSLYFRDAAGNPIVPPAERLPQFFPHAEPPPPIAEQLSGAVAMALEVRPEMAHYQLRKEQMAVELQLAENQILPALNAVVAGSQDVGPGKEEIGIFALDRTVAEAALLMDVPLQRRDARGRMRAARAELMKLLNEERFARDQIVVDVQDAISDMVLTFGRLQRARQEQAVAQRVAELERDRFEQGESTLLEVNLRELAAADAQNKVVAALADFFRAQADYQAALGRPGP